jgi:hypothetical protein
VLLVGRALRKRGLAPPLRERLGGQGCHAENATNYGTSWPRVSPQDFNVSATAHLFGIANALHAVGTPCQPSRVFAVLASPVLIRLPVFKANLPLSREAVIGVSVLEVPTERPVGHGTTRRIGINHIPLVVVAFYPSDEIMMSTLMSFVYKYIQRLSFPRCSTRTKHRPTGHIRSTRRIALLLGYVDLYRRSQLADLLERAYRWYRHREVPPQSCGFAL